jgi:hypothetical protein
MGHLAWADAFIITADSVSMLSEACSTGWAEIYLVYCILLWRCITKLDISFLTGNLFMLLELSTVGGNSWIFMTVYMSMGLFVLSLDWKM